MTIRMTYSAACETLASAKPITAAELTLTHLDVLQMTDLTMAQRADLCDADDEIKAGSRGPGCRAAVAIWNARRGASMKLTAKTITDRQIRQLSAEAGQHGDAEMVALCSRALTWEDEYRIALDHDAKGHHNRAAAWEDVRRVESARGRCADAINAARAQEDA